MPKFCGKIGLFMQEETAPGVWDDRIIEKKCYGETVRDNRRFQNHSQQNDDITTSNSFSIVADREAYTYFHSIKYIEYMGVKWKVEAVDGSNPPRLTLDVGGVYNG